MSVSSNATATDPAIQTRSLSNEVDPAPSRRLLSLDRRRLHDVFVRQTAGM